MSELPAAIESIHYPELELLARWVDQALEDINSISDGTNINTFDGATNPGGVKLGISKSQKPDGSVEYRTHQMLPPDMDGYIRWTSYYWGHDEPTVSEVVIHKDRMLSSSIHPDDSIEKRPQVSDDFPKIERIITEYQVHKDK